MTRGDAAEAESVNAQIGGGCQGRTDQKGEAANGTFFGDGANERN
jgi:hypothetical protein